MLQKASTSAFGALMSVVPVSIIPIFFVPFSALGPPFRAIPSISRAQYQRGSETLCHCRSPENLYESYPPRVSDELVSCVLEAARPKAKEKTLEGNEPDETRLEMKLGAPDCPEEENPKPRRPEALVRGAKRRVSANVQRITGLPVYVRLGLPISREVVRDSEDLLVDGSPADSHLVGVQVTLAIVIIYNVSLVHKYSSPAQAERT